MVSGLFPIATRELIAPGSKSVSENGAEDSFPPKGSKDRPHPEATDLQAVAEAVNEKIGMIHNVDLQFAIHEGSGQMVVTVMDSTTGEIIREIPPSEILNLAARLEEMVGLLFDQVG